MTVMSPAQTGQKRRYVCRILVTFEDTSVATSVYYANYVRWQGRCREAFLRQFAPGVIDDINRGLALVTLRCSCDYLGEVFAFDDLSVEMELLEMWPSRMTLGFTYVVERGGERHVVARGEQHLSCMRRREAELVPEPWPRTLVDALRPYRAG